MKANTTYQAQGQEFRAVCKDGEWQVLTRNAGTIRWDDALTYFAGDKADALGTLAHLLK